MISFYFVCFVFFYFFFFIFFVVFFFFFFFQAEDGIRDLTVTGVQTCALPIWRRRLPLRHRRRRLRERAKSRALETSWTWKLTSQRRSESADRTVSQTAAVFGYRRRIGVRCREVCATVTPMRVLSRAHARFRSPRASAVDGP